MQHAISPVTVFPSTATGLVVNDNWGTIPTTNGNLPQFSYTLTDASGNGLASGSSNMTLAQWNGWGTATTDTVYILSCVAANLGLTLTP
jgi:hypothetical protein